LRSAPAQMAAPDRRADPAALGRRGSSVPESLCVRIPAADPGREGRYHPRVRARAARGEAGGVCFRADGIHRGREDRGMKFFNFHLMPYRHADLDAIEKNGSAWVTFSNSHYDPQKGAELYHEYLDQMEFADKLGFDG